MANEEQKYTSEFKSRVASEALEQNKENLDSLSDKYDVPVSVILTWTVQFEKGGSDVFQTTEASDKAEARLGDQDSVELEVEDADVAESISFGVMHDDLNYKRLIFWSILGVILVVIFVQALFEMYEYNADVTQDRISEQSEYYQLNQLETEAEETLTSFGVVNLEEGIYRIPIDSAMDDIANEPNAN